MFEYHGPEYAGMQKFFATHTTPVKNTKPTRYTLDIQKKAKNMINNKN